MTTVTATETAGATTIMIVMTAIGMIGIATETITASAAAVLRATGDPVMERKLLMVMGGSGSHLIRILAGATSIRIAAMNATLATSGNTGSGMRRRTVKATNAHGNRTVGAAGS